MGLSTKQVSGDQGIDDGQTLQQFDAAELSKPPVRRQQQQQQQSDASKCPRCESSNTKFCYYNNYNKSQPRHFCKSCKRHWTKGGTLRNVPLGGGRKNKRPKISNATNTAATSTIDDQKPTSSSGFYQADLIGHDQPFLGNDKGVINTTTTTTSATTTCLNESAQPQNSIAEFQYFSSVSTNIDTNGSLFPVSYQSLNVYDQYSCNLDSMEESTITTVNIPTTSNVPWTGKDNSTMDLSNYWDWNEIDVITSSDHFNLSWDDEEIDGGAKIKP